MLDLITRLIPALVVDIMNPVLFGFMVFAVGTKKPLATSCCLLLGHTLAYFLAGIALSMGLEAIGERLANPREIDFLISLAVGIALILVALPSRKPEARQNTHEDEGLTPWTALLWGAAVNFVGIPFALPYFGAISQILVADISTTEAVLALAAYNLLYALPFLFVPLMIATTGESSRELLGRVNQLVDKASGILMPLLLAGLGLFLVADAINYYRGGAPLL